MAIVTHMKCACENCLCVIALEDAIKKNEKSYCSEECAEGHPQGVGCGHSGCGC